MRPVDKGPCPLDERGRKVKFSEYTQARPCLIERIGGFCSYCEMSLDAALAVEHVMPKSKRPDLEREWDNFLLACPNCNSTKGNADIVLDEYIWPHKDNTFLALAYSRGGLVEPSPGLASNDRKRAERLIDLVGLDRRAGNLRTASDRRWENRREAWNKAVDALNRWKQYGSEILAEQIVDTAASRGFWSVWMTVFRDEPVVLRKLIEALPGTAAECFDSDCRPLPRKNPA